MDQPAQDFEMDGRVKPGHDKRRWCGNEEGQAAMSKPARKGCQYRGPEPGSLRHEEVEHTFDHRPDRGGGADFRRGYSGRVAAVWEWVKRAR